MATRRKSQTSRTKARHRKQKPDTTEVAEADPADAAALDAGEFLNMITGAWVSEMTGRSPNCIFSTTSPRPPRTSRESRAVIRGPPSG